MTKRWAWFTGFGAVLVAAIVSVSMIPKPQPLSFLDRYPFHLMCRAETIRLPNGDSLIGNTYAVFTPLDEVAASLEPEAKKLNLLKTVGKGVPVSWRNSDSSLSIEVTPVKPQVLREPGPAGTTGYVFAVAPDPLSLNDRAWQIWWHFTH